MEGGTMERLDLVIKTVAGAIVGFISWMIAGVGLAFTILLALMMIDFATGLLVAIVEKKTSSKIGTKGLIKKLYIILLIGATYLVELLILKSSGVVTEGISGAFGVIEFVSIVENGNKLHVSLPVKIKELAMTLKSKVGEKNPEVQTKKDDN